MSLLQTVFSKRYPEGHSYHVRCLPRKKSSTFDTYVNAALRKLGKSGAVKTPSPCGRIPTPLQNCVNAHLGQNDGVEALSQELHTTYSKLESHSPQVTVLLLLRALVAPVLESFILLDRYFVVVVILPDHGRRSDLQK